MTKLLSLGTQRNDENNAPVKLMANALTTHAAVMGMTGSGKTGVLLGMVENMIDNEIPIIMIDIKGDLANIALMNDPVRRAKMNLKILSPGGMHAHPVNVFAGLNDPERCSFTLTTLLKMLGEKDPSPIKSKPHAFLSKCMEIIQAKKTEVDLLTLIKFAMDPPFSHLGALELDDVFPKRSRIALAAKLNTVLAAPSFAAWRSGEPLNVGKLYAPNADGRTNVTVISVAHLVDDEERVFAITTILQEIVSWMRRLEGHRDLRAVLMIDECFGILPPYPKNPPTKTPILTMLKQARAFGLGLVLSTQNPMDLDYKAMANCQTWIVGRLQTANDRKRVLDVLAASSSHDRCLMEARIGRLGDRCFMLVRPKGTADFVSRDVDVTLQGPLTNDELSVLAYAAKPKAQIDDDEEGWV